MTSPQYLLLDAKWLQKELKDARSFAMSYVEVLKIVLSHCIPEFPQNTLLKREIVDLRKQVEDLQKENFALASNQCHDGYGDDYGNHRCRQIDELRSEVEELKTQLALYEEPDEDSHIPCDHNFQSQVNDNSSQYDTLVCTKCGLPTMSCTMTLTPDHEEETSPQPEQ